MTPYLVTSGAALFEDVWLWSSGAAESAYQIWGWGGSNLVLAFGLVESRFDYWPFWITEMLIAVPLLLILLRRQFQSNNWPEPSGATPSSC